MMKRRVVQWSAGARLHVLATMMGLLLLSAPAFAQGEEVFAEGLELVQRKMASEKWSAAKSDLLELLEEHGPAEYVMSQAESLRNDLRLCSFGASYRQPKLDALLAGDVKRYSASSGKFEVRYDEETPELPPLLSSDDTGLVHLAKHYRQLPSNTVFRPSDFVRVGDGLLVHPVPFVGSCTVEIVGELPETESRTQPHVLIAISENRYYDVGFTWPIYRPGSWSTPYRGAIEHVEEGASEMVAADRTVISKYRLGVGRTYKAKVILKGDSIRATINGTSGWDVEADKELGGRIGFAGFPSIEKVTLSGTVDVKWVAGLFEKHRKAAAAEFNETYVADDLPEWLAPPPPPDPED